jgi:hypothetical protein
MCKNFHGLRFTHFIVSATEGTVFGCAREIESGYTYNFIFSRDTVRTQNQGQWVELNPETAEIIRERAEQSYAGAPTYQTDRLLIN